MANPTYGSPNFSTTLNVGGGITSVQTTGIILTSVSGLNTGGGILGFTWASTIDTATYEEIEYTGITGNELTGVIRGVAGTTGKAHLNTAVVIAVISSLHNNRIADKLRSVDAVLAQDTSNNEIIKTTFVASAVNEVTVSNAATGNAPSLAATGGDTNIDLNLTPKGSGKVKTGADEVVTLIATQTLTNKTLTSPVINTPTGDIVSLTGTQTLTNKTLGTGAVNATAYNPFIIQGGHTSNSYSQQTTGVSTSAVVILATLSYLTFALVFGSDGTNRFSDVVLMSTGSGTINVISSLNAAGTPAARTYDQSGSTLRLLVASGTYTVRVLSFQMGA